MKGMIKKKEFLSLVCFLSIWTFCTIPAGGEEYPTKPIDFIINFSAGGTTDISSRALMDLAGKFLGQPMVAINKPGAAGAIGVTYIKNAKPDGYTIGLLTTSPAFVVPFLPDVTYDILRDFTPIAHYAEYLFLCAVRSDKPWKTWKDLIDYARSHPGEVKIGIAGSKSTNVNGIALSRVMAKENVKFTFIPLKGGGEMLAATLGGHVDVFAASVEPTVKEYITTGKLRVLAFISDKKLPGFENIPNLRELHGVWIPNALGVIGPKGLPPNIVRKLEEAFLKSMQDPSFSKLMASMNTAITPMTSKQFGEYIERTYKEQKEVMEKIRAEEKK